MEETRRIYLRAHPVDLFLMLHIGRGVFNGTHLPKDDEGGTLSESRARS